jgi:hyperosmotically inducible periplasmic protein
LLLSIVVSGSDISVTTNDGVVALGGHVNSEAERELAVELTRGLRGVKKVDAADLGFSPAVANQ